MSYDSVMSRVGAAAARAGRDPDRVTVVAVSKERTVEEIMDLYERGHRDFGENRAQELAVKAAALPADIRWHFVGVLQSNKARVVRPIVNLLHSLDRESLALAWLKGHGLPPPVLIQVNIGGEEQKSGVSPSQAADLVARVVELGLEVRGLMTVPPVPENPEASRPLFRAMAELSGSIRGRWPEASLLSMGMSDDFETAIEEGSSMIRVGRAIFATTNEPGAR